MGRGVIAANKLRTERYKLTPLTSDPAATNEGEAWLRGDLAPESNQIATLRVDTGGSTIDVPILQAGTSADDIVEALRVHVGATTGYIPARPASDAAFPALRLQHNGQVYGFHNARGATAFFDVAITATNAPVVEGDPLNVDYSVSNTGGSLDDTQDIVLDVGSTERDRDSSVTVGVGESTTGQLSWASTTQGDYTATVASDDDSASTSVSVDAIPDSVVSLYEFEDEGTTSTAEDSEGSNPLNILSAGSYDTDAAVGDHALLADGSGFAAESQNTVDLVASGTEEAFSLAAWLKDDTGARTSNDTAVGWKSDSTSAGLRIIIQNGTWVCQLRGSNNNNADSGVNPSGDYEHVVGYATQSEVGIYVDDTLEASVSHSEDISTIGAGRYLLGDYFFDNIYQGLIDEVALADGELTSGDVSTLYDRK